MNCCSVCRLKLGIVENIREIRPELLIIAKNIDDEIKKTKKALKSLESSSVVYNDSNKSANAHIKTGTKRSTVNLIYNILISISTLKIF